MHNEFENLNEEINFLVIVHSSVHSRFVRIHQYRGWLSRNVGLSVHHTNLILMILLEMIVIVVRFAFY